MHWTLSILVALTLTCALANAVQWRMAGAVRPVGLLVCGFWTAQQLWWWAAGDSLVFTLGCDFMLAWFLWSRRETNHWTDWAVFGAIPLTMACYVPRYIGPENVTLWWINIALVAAQMIFAMPALGQQRIGWNVSHGPLRKVEHEGA